MGNSESNPSSNTRNRQRTFQQTNNVYSTTPRPPQGQQQTNSVHSTTPRPQVPQQTNSVHSTTSQPPQVRLSNLNLQTGDLIDLTDPGKYPKNKIVDKYTCKKNLFSKG